MPRKRRISRKDFALVSKIATIVAFRYLPEFDRHAFSGTSQSASKRLSAKAEGLITKDELYNQGVIGLLKAVKRFDPERGVLFAAYAYSLIQGEMISMIRSKGALIHVPQERYQEMTELQKARESGSTDAEIAKSSGWGMDKVVQLEQLRPRPISTSTEKNDDKSGRVILGNLLEFNGKSPEELMEQKEIMEIVSRCIDNIKREKSRLILISRYMEGQTLKALAEKHDCSIQTVKNRQIEAEVSTQRCLEKNGVSANG